MYGVCKRHYPKDVRHMKIENKGKILCPMCLLSKGLDDENRDEVTFDTEEEFADHMESEHHIPVQKEGLTEEENMVRFREKYPEAKDTKTCKCPSCKAKRGDSRDAVAYSLRMGLNENDEEEEHR